MTYLKNKTYKEIINSLNGKNVHFKASCDAFPNFDVSGKILSYTITNKELVFKLKVRNTNKIIDVGCNMNKLRYEYIKE